MGWVEFDQSELMLFFVESIVLKNQEEGFINTLRELLK